MYKPKKLSLPPVVTISGSSPDFFKKELARRAEVEEGLARERSQLQQFRDQTVVRKPAVQEMITKLVDGAARIRRERSGICLSSTCVKVYNEHARLEHDYMHGARELTAMHRELKSD